MFEKPLYVEVSSGIFNLNDFKCIRLDTELSGGKNKWILFLKDKTFFHINDKDVEGIKEALDIIINIKGI